MRFWSLVSCVLLLSVAAPSLADIKPEDHPPMRIDPMPAGWTAHPMDLTYMAFNEDGDMIQLNSSANDPTTFESWCKTMKKQEDDGSGWTDSKSTEMRPATVGPPGTMEFDTTGKRGDEAMHGHVYFLPVGKVFCTLKCFSTAAAWGKNKAVFDEMAKNVKAGAKERGRLSSVSLLAICRSHLA